MFSKGDACPGVSLVFLVLVFLVLVFLVLYREEIVNLAQDNQRIQLDPGSRRLPDLDG